MLDDHHATAIIEEMENATVLFFVQYCFLVSGSSKGAAKIRLDFLRILATTTIPDDKKLQAKLAYIA